MLCFRRLYAIVLSLDVFDARARVCVCVCVVHWHCTAQSSMFNMEKRYRNKIIIIIIIIKFSVPLYANLSVEVVVTRKSHTTKNLPCTVLQFPVVLTSLKASSPSVSSLRLCMYRLVESFTQIRLPALSCVHNQNGGS